MGELRLSKRRFPRRQPLSAALVLLMLLPPAAASADTSVPWTAFSESSGCESPFTATPVATKTGFLSDSELVLGPFGRYFGWTVGQVRQDLVWWTVPGTGGRGIYVHRLAYPSFQQVSQGIADAAARGLKYPIRDAVGFAPRTIGGNHRISRHALGLAIDINPAQNPYRSDNTLITDMPQWFVQIWRDAGFCWGGDWEDSKDAMHFSWIGPTAGTAPAAPLKARAPFTAAVEYGARSTRFSTVYDGATVASRQRSVMIADGNGNGAPDVVALRPAPSGVIMEVASSTTGWQQCSVGRWMVPDVDLSAASHWLLADVDSDSRGDLVVAETSTPQLVVKVATRAGEFEDTAASAVPVDPSGVVALGAGDFDGDRIADLWTFGSDGSFEVWKGPRFEASLGMASVGVSPARVAIADRAGDQTPEIYVLDQAGNVIVFESTGSGWQERESAGFGPAASGSVAFGVLDHDGDSRPDIHFFNQDGELSVFFGNTAVGGSVNRWYANVDTDCDGEIPVMWNGTFFDDDGSPFESDIESILRAGVTKGCSEFGDEYCPDDSVTRGQMAAFLARALALPPGSGNRFVDDDGSGFENEIEALVAAGITNGCDVDRFCPDDLVTREQMAAFLARALDLPPGIGDRFVDDQTSLFQAEIEALVDAGITNGCDVDRFCPWGAVTRGQMAAFLSRAGLGG